MISGHLFKMINIYLSIVYFLISLMYKIEISGVALLYVSIPFVNDIYIV